ncbi:hypothetical protein C1H46_033189 [Malus baccata]|uniref:Uncharacterized protein n=1 Tax=Malus baccata TaxID=106549 RepID=A0A540L454_MALBA|nr:hypothetical protein C1H46_033189 [Malus baccata]
MRMQDDPFTSGKLLSNNVQMLTCYNLPLIHFRQTTLDNIQMLACYNLPLHLQLNFASQSHHPAAAY